MPFIPIRPNEEAMVALSRLEEDVAKKYVNSCVQAIIVLGQNRNPIKRQDLNRLAFPHLNNYRLIGHVLQQANKVLHKTFAMRLYELEDKTKYLLVASDPDSNKYQEWSDKDNLEMTVLYFVLTDIFASPDDRVNEDDMFDKLKVLELTRDNFNNILDSLVKKLYLQTDRRQQEHKVLRWGSRAEAEIEPEKFFAQFLKLVNETSDKNWPELRVKINKLKSLRND